MVSAATLNDAATLALANAMYRYTFGIVVDGRFGAEGCGLGSGIGVLWKKKYLILTADHVVAGTPFDRLYFLLPDEALEFAGSTISNGFRPVRVRKRFALEKPQIVQGDNDLAAFVLPSQEHDIGRSHFYSFDEHQTTPPNAEQIGVIGYPGKARVPVGTNYMATLFCAFGAMGRPTSSEFDSVSQFAIAYPSVQTIDPPGLSGSGLWLPTDNGQAIWKPTIQLVGLTTHHDQVSAELIGYKAETIIEFLRNKI